MKIIITGQAKEIADFVLAAQNRQHGIDNPINNMTEALLKASRDIDVKEKST